MSRSFTYRAESLGVAVSPIRNPVRDFLTSAHGVAGVSETYNIPLPRFPLWTRKGVVSGWVPKYESGSQKGGDCVWCGPSCFGEEVCAPHGEPCCLQGDVNRSVWRQ
jgi:hypothetical protein